MTVFAKATKVQLGAVIQCRSPELVPLKQMFEDALDDTKSSLVRAVDAVHIHRLQGQAQALQEFLVLLETAHQIVGRLK